MVDEPRRRIRGTDPLEQIELRRLRRLELIGAQVVDDRDAVQLDVTEEGVGGVDRVAMAA